MSYSKKHFDDGFFFNEINRISGSGGEILVKSPENAKSPATQIDVGDHFIGIGLAHGLENLGETLGLKSFRLPLDITKTVARGPEVIKKEKTSSGFNFHFGPLSPQEFSESLEKVSEGRVMVPANSIPKGTIVLSYLDDKPAYTLESIEGSPGENWERATKGDRHWNVGVAKESDFWFASFPWDDIRMLAQIPSSTNVGSISFGLSLLPGGNTKIKEFKPVEAIHPTGKTTTHQFYLSGASTGTKNWNSPFTVGLRTGILCHPVK